MYHLRCLGCGATYPDDGLMLRCPHEHAPALLRTQYARTQFHPDERAQGIMRYRSWLPVRSELPGDLAHTAVFQSSALCAYIGTPNLWIAFNGYWPARGAFLPTGTFKDLETAAVLARFPRSRTLVAASAGNTAAALARACSMQRVRAMIVIPKSAEDGVLAHGPFGSCVRIIALPGASYDDAIEHAKDLTRDESSLFFEGGAHNVARRDGIGTTMLAAVERLGRLPEWFVAAIGSGAGAIAAHEAALRVRADGRYGSVLPRLLLVQNTPSAPVYESWRRGSRTLIGGVEDVQSRRERAASLWAPVLSAQAPPYAIAGGLYDTLRESDGEVGVADNAQAKAACELFASLEGARIAAASGVALAGLLDAVQNRRIERDATILLHITGGYGEGVGQPASGGAGNGNAAGGGGANTAAGSSRRAAGA